MANFSTEGWSGPASVHYQEKRKQLIEFRKGEDNDNVKRWIDEYVSSIDRQIERERIEEERAKLDKTNVAEDERIGKEIKEIQKLYQ